MMDPQDAPDVVMLWQRTQTARKPHECYICHAEIAPGERYETMGLRNDGAFEYLKCHQGGYRYPSCCPKYRERDLAETEAQFRKDAELWNPTADAQNTPGDIS